MRAYMCRCVYVQVHVCVCVSVCVFMQPNGLTAAVDREVVGSMLCR